MNDSSQADSTEIRFVARDVSPYRVVGFLLQTLERIADDRDVSAPRQYARDNLEALDRMGWTELRPRPAAPDLETRQTREGRTGEA